MSKRYMRVIAVLEALPSKALSRKRYVTKRGNVCPIGALVGDVSEDHDDPFDESIHTIALFQRSVAKRLASFGLSVEEAQALQDFNDSIAGPKSGRYALVLRRLRSGKKLKARP